MKDFLFTLLAWLLTLPFLVGAIAFSVYNETVVDVTTSPFKAPVALPLYVPVLFAIAFGFLFGAIMTWAAMGRLRAQKRSLVKKVKSLEKQLDTPTAPTPMTHNYGITPLKLLGRK